ncbi:unnamed protein product [Hermetia illucens]|uniref:Uncharacterized protein n=1 Tax=Hermetia illucens TaxID=343691 RepID=A0A7R8UTH4_HERIL|nr:uncharacterized protein LOC119655535 [Hermetia illucens]CAD7086781.1 unnamed protein product [Hermetia illucens]
MKAVFALVLLALFAIVAADVSELSGPSNEYLPPFKNEQDFGRIAAGFGPPTQSGEPAPAHSFGPDGYRYKNPTARRF